MLSSRLFLLDKGWRFVCIKIMFSAGETSGDMHGANLAKALKNICSDIEMFGFGGPQMEQAGVKLCKNMLDYSVMVFGKY